MEKTQEFAEKRTRRKRTKIFEHLYNPQTSPVLNDIFKQVANQDYRIAKRCEEQRQKSSQLNIFANTDFYTLKSYSSTVRDYWLRFQRVQEKVYKRIKEESEEDNSWLQKSANVRVNEDIFDFRDVT